MEIILGLGLGSRVGVCGRINACTGMAVGAGRASQGDWTWTEENNKNY